MRLKDLRSCVCVGTRQLSLVLLNLMRSWRLLLSNLHQMGCMKNHPVVSFITGISCSADSIHRSTALHIYLWYHRTTQTCHYKTLKVCECVADTCARSSLEVWLVLYQLALYLSSTLIEQSCHLKAVLF